MISRLSEQLFQARFRVTKGLCEMTNDKRDWQTNTKHVNRKLNCKERHRERTLYRGQRHHYEAHEQVHRNAVEQSGKHSMFVQNTELPARKVICSSNSKSDKKMKSQTQSRSAAAANKGLRA